MADQLVEREYRGADKEEEDRAIALDVVCGVVESELRGYGLAVLSLVSRGWIYGGCHTGDVRCDA